MMKHGLLAEKREQSSGLKTAWKDGKMYMDCKKEEKERLLHKNRVKDKKEAMDEEDVHKEFLLLLLPMSR